MKVKYAFVDIDGVLNNQLYFEAERKAWEASGEKTRPQKYEIDPRCIELLNVLVKQTGVKIVISSTWRSSYTVEEFQTMFGEFGFKGEIVGLTPHLSLYKPKEMRGMSVPRGVEIKMWLNHNIDYKERPYIKYIILDDDSDMLLGQKEKYFQVDAYAGLTPNLIYRASNYLNGIDYG